MGKFLFSIFLSIQSVKLSLDEFKLLPKKLVLKINALADKAIFSASYFVSA